MGHDVVLYAGLFFNGKIIRDNKGREQLYFSTVPVRKDHPPTRK